MSVRALFVIVDNTPDSRSHLATGPPSPPSPASNLTDGPPLPALFPPLGLSEENTVVVEENQKEFETQEEDTEDGIWDGEKGKIVMQDMNKDENIEKFDESTEHKEQERIDLDDDVNFPTSPQPESDTTLQSEPLLQTWESKDESVNFPELELVTGQEEERNASMVLFQLKQLLSQQQQLAGQQEGELQNLNLEPESEQAVRPRQTRIVYINNQRVELQTESDL